MATAITLVAGPIVALNQDVVGFDAWPTPAADPAPLRQRLADSSRDRALRAEIGRAMARRATRSSRFASGGAVDPLAPASGFAFAGSFSRAAGRSRRLPRTARAAPTAAG